MGNRLLTGALPLVLLAGALAGCTDGLDEKVTWSELTGQTGADARDVVNGQPSPDVPEFTPDETVEETQETVEEPAPTPEPQPDPAPAPQPQQRCIAYSIDAQQGVIKPSSSLASTQYSKAGMRREYHIQRDDVVEHGVAMVRPGTSSVCGFQDAFPCSWQGFSKQEGSGDGRVSAQSSASPSAHVAILGLLLDQQAQNSESGYPKSAFVYTLYAKTADGAYHFTPWESPRIGAGIVEYYHHHKGNNIAPDDLCDVHAKGLL